MKLGQYVIKISMKRIIVAVLAISFVSTTLARESIDDVPKNTDRLYRKNGDASSDGAYTAISTSMIAWGVGLAVAIALLAAAFSKSSSSSNAHCHN